MEEHSNDHLRVLGQLAREYEKKVQELHEALRSVPLKWPHECLSCAER